LGPKSEVEAHIKETIASGGGVTVGAASTLPMGAAKSATAGAQ
jgi:hypothetical protein